MAQRTCPACRQPVPPGWNLHCPFCGYSFAAPAPPAPGYPARVSGPQSDRPMLPFPPRITTITVILLLALAFGLVWQPAGQIASGPQKVAGLTGSARCDKDLSPHVGDLAPDFTLTDLDGHDVQLQSYRGSQPVWINFWQSSCIHCVNEMPIIERVYQRYKDRGVAVLGVNVDQDPDAVAQFIQDNGYDWTFLLDDGTVSGQYCVTNVPTHLFIDQEGRIRSILVGQMNAAQMQAELDQLLAP
jgi:peroxiredoxin